MRKLDALSGIVVHIVRGNDTLWRNVVFDPLDERSEQMSKTFAPAPPLQWFIPGTTATAELLSCEWVLVQVQPMTAALKSMESRHEERITSPRK